jgi:hypothetical protein
MTPSKIFSKSSHARNQKMKKRLWKSALIKFSHLRINRSKINMKNVLKAILKASISLMTISLMKTTALILNRKSTCSTLAALVKNSQKESTG